MSTTRLNILVIEDNPGDARLVSEMLRDAFGRSVEVTTADRLGQGLALVAASTFDTVLLDLSLPDSEGLTSLLSLREAAPQLPLVLLTGLDDELVAVEAMQHGAQDYLVKGSVDTGSLWRAIRYAIERQQLTARLSASEQRFRQIVEQTTDAVLIVDLQGRVRLANPAAERLLHRPARLLKGERLPFGVDDAGAREVTLTRPDGQVVPAELRAVRTAFDGEEAFIASLRDLSDQRKAEDERAQSRTLQGMLELAAATCHELNQPLQILAGYLPLCLAAAPGNTELASHVEVMGQQVTRLGEVTRKLGHLTRYELRDYPGGPRPMVDLDRSSADD